MTIIKDGPNSKLFSPVAIKGNTAVEGLKDSDIPKDMAEASVDAASGECVCWGMPFKINKVVLIKDRVIALDTGLFKAKWLVFMHTSDVAPVENNEYGFISSIKGFGRLGEHIADYVVIYDDAGECRIPIKRRYQINCYNPRWGENSIECIPCLKPCPVRPPHEQNSNLSWGRSQNRLIFKSTGNWASWLFAWENPSPDKKIASIRIEPKSGVIVLSAISSGDVSSTPIRWQARKKAVFKLPENEKFMPDLDDSGLLSQIKLDMGQVISASPRPVYPNNSWEKTRCETGPVLSANEVLIEYSSHPDASFHVFEGRIIPAGDVESNKQKDILEPVAPATQKIILKTIEKGSRNIIPVRLHLHGEAGEYLSPVDRLRIPNPAFMEEYAPDYVHMDAMYYTYINGETEIKLPLGNIYAEISKGFEYKPARRIIKIKPSTKEITIELEKSLKWQEKGWASSDTHVHFISLRLALLEGAGQGVNVVYVLAIQDEELIAGAGDFDGETVAKDRSGKYLANVGSENRNGVLGHISLIGFKGRIIAPISTGGGCGCAALGDPLEILQTEYAIRCRKQGGIVILSHFPEPRLENAAVIVSGNADAVEMRETYGMLDPFSVSDWYKYLNCGYILPIVSGTDKLETGTLLGKGRGYTFIGKNKSLTQETWMQAVKKGNTFATTGPLLEFSVNGKTPCSCIRMPKTGGMATIKWTAASSIIPISKVQLIRNGKVIGRVAVNSDKASGSWQVKIEESSWLALLVRAQHPGEAEIIGAHSSPVMINVKGSRLFNAIDAGTILEQIKGTLAYIETLGIRPDSKTFKRMKSRITSISRNFQKRMY